MQPTAHTTTYTYVGRKNTNIIKAFPRTEPSETFPPPVLHMHSLYQIWVRAAKSFNGKATVNNPLVKSHCKGLPHIKRGDEQWSC